MNEEDIEKAALASAANMGPAENAWVPEIGQIIKNGALTPVGSAYLRPFMGTCIGCDMPIGRDFNCLNCFPTPDVNVKLRWINRLIKRLRGE